MTTRAHVYISGRVQGVGFRAATRRKAATIGVDGWVKNLADGRVEAVFEGESDQVDSMMEWAESGPSTARVDEIDLTYEAPMEVDGFEIRR
jgi:acylphosphatase